MIQFFAPDIEVNPVLPESDSGHCIRVLRLRMGDEISVIDGKGCRFLCRIIDPHPKRTLLEVTAKEYIPNPWPGEITLAVAPTKNIDRMEWLVEKLTEIGVNRFVPILTKRSERKEIKTERLEKIAVSAMKQSLKTSLPQVNAMTSLKDFVNECKAEQRFVAYCDDTMPRHALAQCVIPKAKSTAILIGPEGDFTPDEIEMTISAGFIPVTLGDCRLRTETAALAAVQTIHVINQLHL